MPDITMCMGTNCPYKEGCYRFTAKPGDYQSYFMTPPFTKDGCEMYWGDAQSQIWNQLQDIVKPK
jgi:hypothetical protein